MTILLSSLLKDMILATIKNMPPDNDFVQVQEIPSFFVSRIMISKEDTEQRNLLLLETIKGEESDEKEYFIYQSQ